MGVTELLIDWSNGDKGALDRLIPLVYEELRAIAQRHLSREESGHTLQSTALVHEAYLRLAGIRTGAKCRIARTFSMLSAQLIRTMSWITRGVAKLVRERLRS